MVGGSRLLRVLLLRLWRQWSSDQAAERGGFRQLHVVRRRCRPVLSGSGLPLVSGPPSVENVSASGHTLAWRPLSLKLTYSHCSLLTLRFCVVQISSSILSDCAFVCEVWPFQTAYRGDALSLPQSVWCVFRVTVER